MLSVSCCFANRTFPCINDAITLLIKYNDIVKYIEEAEPSIPTKFFRNGSPYEINIFNGYTSKIAQTGVALTPPQHAILLDFKRWGTTASNGLKYNIDLIDNHHQYKNSFRHNTFYALNKSVDFISSFGQNFYLNHQATPQDGQTILTVGSKFNPTTKICNIHGSKKIYRNIQNNTYCYIDHMHTGNGAHIEVFSANGTYLGTMGIYNDNVSPSQRARNCNVIP